MPTGYTADVGDGKVTEFRDFALRCARGMGALIMMRDDPMDAPIPDEFKPSMHCLEVAEETDAEIRELEDADSESLAAMAEADFTESFVQWTQRRLNRKQQQQRYETMLGKVYSYQPPSPEHEGFKDFMREQLAESIRFDCSGQFDDRPQRLSAKEWKEKKLQELRQRRESSHKMHLEEVERTASRNLWIKQLRESLQ